MKTRLRCTVVAAFLLATMTALCESAPYTRTRLEIKAVLEEKVDWIGFDYMAFSPDGKLLAAPGGGDFLKRKPNVIRLWDVATAQVVASLPDPRCDDLVFSPDGKLLAARLQQSTTSGVWLWDVASRKRIAVLPKKDPVRWMIFGPDSKEILVCENSARDGRLMTWSVEKKEEVRSRKTIGDPRLVDGYPSLKKPLLIDMHDPDFLFKRPSMFMYTLREAFTGEKVFVCEGSPPHTEIFAIDREETVVASITRPDAVQLWDRATGKNIATWNKVYGGGLRLSPDGRILALRYRETPAFDPHGWKGIRLYEVPSGKILETLDEATDTFGFSPDGRFFATVKKPKIKLWTIPDAWRKKEEKGKTSP